MSIDVEEAPMIDENGDPIERDAPQQALAKRNATTEIASSRAAQEVQAAMVVAKRFPRDVTAAIARIVETCRRKAFADHSMYAYPRGKEIVQGPNIRMAEVLAQAWGNIDYSVIELERRRGESTMLAVAWDLETNSRASKTFQVPHTREVGKGQNRRSVPVEGDRDTYEITANMASRRLRACILSVIPKDITDAAVAECKKTMAGGNKEPLIDRARKMVVAFADLGVSQAMIEQRLGHKIEAMVEPEMVNLRTIYASLKENQADREDFFQVGGQAPATNGAPRAQSLADRLKSEQTPDTAAKAAAAKAALKASEGHVSSSPDAQPPADWQPENAPQSEPGENG